MDPARKPGQHLAPGMDDTARHRAAALPGEEQGSRVPGSSKAQGVV